MWLQYLIGAAVLIGLDYCVSVMIGYRTRILTRKTDRTAESMYDDYADSIRQQRKYAAEHGGEWRDGEGTRQPDNAGRRSPS
jgi:hypothetical protein